MPYHTVRISCPCGHTIQACLKGDGKKPVRRVRSCIRCGRVLRGDLYPDGYFVLIPPSAPAAVRESPS